MDEGGSLPDVKPSLVLQIETIMAAVQKVARAEAVERRRVHVVVSLPNPDRLLHEQCACHKIAAWHAVEAEGVAVREGHAGLKENEGAQRGKEAVGVEGLVHVQRLLLEARAVEDGHGAVHVGEEEIDARLDNVALEEAGRRGERRARRRSVDAIHSILDLGRETGLALLLLELVDDLGAGPFRALLLRNRIVGTRQLRAQAVAAGVDAVAFDLAAMAGIARALDGDRHCVRGSWEGGRGGGASDVCLTHGRRANDR